MKLRHLSVIAALSLGCVAPASGALVHRYAFNDGTANDSVGTANGTLVHGPTITGGELVFDPAINNGINNGVVTGQYVDLPTGILNLKDFTIEAWFTFRGGNTWQRVYDFGNVQQKIDVTPSDSTQSYAGQGFITLGAKNGPGNIFAQISRDSHGGAGDTTTNAMVTPLPLNTQVHVTWVHDVTGGEQRLYYNDQLISTVATTVDASTITYYNSWIGRSQFGTDPFFNGKIDELRIFDNGLTTAATQFNNLQGPNGVIAVPEPSLATAGLLVGASMMLRRRHRAASKA